MSYDDPQADAAREDGYESGKAQGKKEMLEWLEKYCEDNRRKLIIKSQFGYAFDINKLIEAAKFQAGDLNG
jgi:hypothetical protein